MKKSLIFLLVTLTLCALGAQAFAIALPAGTTYEDYLAGNVQFGEPEAIEVTEWLGRDVEAFNSFVKEKNLNFGKSRTRTSVLHYEDGTWAQCITEFMLYSDGFTVYGYEIDGRLPDGYRAELEAEGWTPTKYQFEGGLEFITFEKTVGEAVYKFGLDACDSVITYLDLSVNDLGAHLAAQQ